MDIPTPSLLLDRARLLGNAQRMADRIGSLDGVLRPHVKTHKCIEAYRDVRAAGRTRGITVSTLQEAEYFFAQGVDDILYAVGISPNKFGHVVELARRGCELTVILDSVAMANLLAEHAHAHGTEVPVLIELDVDGHRAGIDPQGAELMDVAHALHASSGVALRGVMAHAGGSYACTDPAALLQAAREERDRSVNAAQRLRSAGLPCPVVSIGSTPTALAIDGLDGVTEVRAGVYAFFDLVMANIGVCSLDDIAISVLVSVTGHQRERGLLITDGGWMALSRDRGTEKQPVDYGYGAVADAGGELLSGLLMTSANQEHGLLSKIDGQPMRFEDFPVGSQLRILPNHACATAGQHRGFHVLEAGQITQFWERTSGW